MSDLYAGRAISALVVEHRPFGIFVDVGEDELGVVVITMMLDDPSVANPEFPPVGERIDAVFLGYAGPGRQPRLSIRPADLRMARDDDH